VVIILIDKLIGFARWLKLFYEIFKHRGKNSYGKEHIKYLFDKLQFQVKENIQSQRKAENFIKSLSQFYSVAYNTNFNLKRIGPRMDGGYFLPKDIEFDYVISGGIGKTSEFEYELARQGKKVIAIDPSIESLPHPHKNIQFIKKWFSNGTFKNSISLEEAISMCPKDSLVLLKLDIEGDEYKVLDKLKNFSDQIIVLVVEFHQHYKLTNLDFLTQYKEITKQISRSYVPISFSSNNWSNFLNIGNSFIPEVFEVTFIHTSYICKKFYSVGKKNITYSNNPNRVKIPNQIFSI
jgi:hypothetical protein